MKLGTKSIGKWKLGIKSINIWIIYYVPHQPNWQNFRYRKWPLGKVRIANLQLSYDRGIINGVVANQTMPYKRKAWVPRPAPQHFVTLVFLQQFILHLHDHINWRKRKRRKGSTINIWIASEIWNDLDTIPNIHVLRLRSFQEHDSLEKGNNIHKLINFFCCINDSTIT